MPKKIKDKVEFQISENKETITVFARIVKQTIKETNRKKLFVGLPEVLEFLRQEKKIISKVLKNPGYITNNQGKYSEYVFEKPIPVKSETSSEDFPEEIKPEKKSYPKPKKIPTFENLD
jgi:hypothetical protein